ncbi:MAG: hypothetical protein EPO16_00470 [Dehalococcoidia bacterium]|nr:MAG: hypothetical protein EPO16_00470 [Dehalococcoidia bacterium]
MRRSHAPRTALAGLLLLAVISTLGGCGDKKGEKATSSEFKVTSLDALKSYRFASDILVSSEALPAQGAQVVPPGGTFRIKASGTRVNPDRQQATIDADLGFLKVNLETVNIAKEQWSKEPQGQWQRGITGAAALLATSDFSPQGLFSGTTGPTSDELTQRLAGRPFTKDSVGGAAARHYVFDRKAFEEVFGTQSAVPESAADVKTQADVWFAESRGVLLRVLITGKNAADKEVLRVDVQVSDIDAASNKVEPPI